MNLHSYVHCGNKINFLTKSHATLELIDMHVQVQTIKASHTAAMYYQ